MKKWGHEGEWTIDNEQTMTCNLLPKTSL